jgi:hypothetical protein
VKGRKEGRKIGGEPEDPKERQERIQTVLSLAELSEGVLGGGKALNSGLEGAKRVGELLKLALELDKHRTKFGQREVTECDFAGHIAQRDEW